MELWLRYCFAYKACHMNVIAIQIDVFAVTGLCGVLDSKRDSSMFKLSADANGISGILLVKEGFLGCRY